MTEGGGDRYYPGRTKKVVVHLVYILSQLSRFRLTYMYYCSGEKVGGGGNADLRDIELCSQFACVFFCACVRACVCACVRACVRVCVRACVRACVCAYMRICERVCVFYM